MKLSRHALILMALLAQTQALAQSISIAAGEGCVFAMLLPPLKSTLQMEIEVKARAMVSAREASEGACRDAGWTDCRHDGTYPAVIEDVDSIHGIATYQYLVPVVSAECTTFVADSKNKGKFEKRGLNFVLLERARALPKLVSEDCRPGTLIVPAPAERSGDPAGASAPAKTGDCGHVEPSREASTRRREIPGDDDGTGRSRKF